MCNTPVRKIRGLDYWLAGADLNGQVVLSLMANVTIYIEYNHLRNGSRSLWSDWNIEIFLSELADVTIYIYQLVKIGGGHNIIQWFVTTGRGNINRVDRVDIIQEHK